MRRIHMIDGLPVSSKEINSYYSWVCEILEMLVNETKKKINMDIPRSITLHF